MTRHFHQSLTHPRSHHPISRGFSLIELLSVMAMFAVLMAVSIPAVQGIKGGHDINKAAFDLAGTLEQARSYAMAHNTHVWVGFYEEDGSRPSQNPAAPGNGGRVIVSVVASRDGSRYGDAVISDTLPAAFGASDASNPVEIVAIRRLLRLENVRMVAANTPGGNTPGRPEVPPAYQVGDPGDPDNDSGAFARRVDATASNPTTFSFPLGAAAPQYTFSKIIEFSPSGEASKIAENVFSGPGPQDAMEIALQPAHGGVIDPKYAGKKEAAAAIQVEGLTGRVRIFRL